MIASAFGAVSNLAPAIRADYVLDFSNGNQPAELIGPDADSVGPRTYCDQERMYIAYPGQPRIGYDHDRMRWGLRRDVGSVNLVRNSQYSAAAWNGSANGLLSATWRAAPFLLGGEMCSMMDYQAASSSYVYPGSSAGSMSYTAGTRYTASMFFKNLDPIGVDIRLRLHPGAFGEYQGVVYRATDGVLVGETSNKSDTVFGVEKYPDGWMRLYVTAVASNTVSSYPPLLWPGGSRTGRFLFGGFQLEALGFPTSYIPTNAGTAVTRGNERGVMASLPLDFFLGGTAGSPATLWADFQAATRFHTSASGIFGLDRATSTGDPYISLAITTDSVGRQAVRTYYTASPTSTGSPSSAGYITPTTARNVHASTWRNDQAALVQTHLSAEASGTTTPITPWPSFAGMPADLNSPRMLLGSMMQPTNYILTGWLYELRIYRRFMTDDQLKELVGI